MNQPDAVLAERDVANQSAIRDLNARAACLINPESGIANDFLNHFNEILLLIENLPILLPELVDELLQWYPVSYADYFRRSPLPGGTAALDRYNALSDEAKSYFDHLVERLNIKAVEIVERISTHRRPDGTIPPEEVGEYCAVASTAFRSELDLLALFVNCGYGAAISAAGAAATA